MGPSVKCANWPSQSNCEAISCALSSKTPTFITIHEMQPFPRKCGEMQMFKGWWRQWRSAGRPLCPAQVGHDSYLLWQRPVSTHTGAHKSVHTHTLRSKPCFFLFLSFSSLWYTHIIWQRAGWCSEIEFRVKVTRAWGYFSIRENQLPLNLKEKLHVCGFSTQRLYGMNDVSEGEILLVLVLWITQTVDAMYLHIMNLAK